MEHTHTHTHTHIRTRTYIDTQIRAYSATYMNTYVSPEIYIYILIAYYTTYFLERHETHGYAYVYAYTKTILSYHILPELDYRIV